MKSKLNRKKSTNSTGKNTRVLARLLSRQITEDELHQVSGGSGSENGRWYWTNTKKVKGYDWEPG